MKDIIQLVVVCRNLAINWEQFKNPIYIGVESGAVALIKNKLPINFVCGDFDTVDSSDLELIKNSASKNNFKIIKFSPAKDYLDSELAIIEALALKLNFDQIVFVTDGGRWDMILAQINFLKKYAQYQPILISNNNYLFALKAKIEFTFLTEHLKYHYISFFSLDGQEVIYNFSGCKYYPDVDVSINDQDVLAISNEFDLKKPAAVKIKKGFCLVCLAKKDN